MLPNLPAMVGQWDWQYAYPTADPFVYIDAIGADPCRWFISFSDFMGAGFGVTTDSSAPFLAGFPCQPSSTIEFKYQDYGAMIGAPWRLSGRGAAIQIQVFSAAIRLRPDFLYSSAGEQDKILNEIRGLRRFIKTIVRQSASPEMRV